MEIKLKTLKDWAKRLPVASTPMFRTLILAEPEKVDAHQFIGKVGTWLKIFEMEITQEFTFRPNPTERTARDISAAGQRA